MDKSLAILPKRRSWISHSYSRMIDKEFDDVLSLCWAALDARQCTSYYSLLFALYSLERQKINVNTS